MSDGDGSTTKYYDIFATSSDSNDAMATFSSSTNYLEQEEQSKRTDTSKQNKILRSTKEDVLGGNIASGKLWKNRTFLSLDEYEY